MIRKGVTSTLGAILLLTVSVGVTGPAYAVASYLCPVPYVNQGSSATIPGTNVTVTATASTAVQGDTANTYLYQSRSRISSTLTFSPAITGLRVVTRFHADAGGGFEQFDFTGTGGAFTATIRNIDTTETYESGTTFGGRLATLGVLYSFDAQTSDFLRGSYLDLYISCGTTEAETTPQITTPIPPPWLQSYGRRESEICRDGWHSSWAEWAINKTGGWVCNRTVFYNGSTWVQNPNEVWGSSHPADNAAWDGS